MKIPIVIATRIISWCLVLYYLCRKPLTWHRAMWIDPYNWRVVAMAALSVIAGGTTLEMFSGDKVDETGFTIKDITNEGPGLGGRFSIGLTESARTLVIGDPVEDYDFGLSGHSTPLVFVFDPGTKELVELDDTTDKQSWLFIEPKIYQSGIRR